MFAVACLALALTPPPVATLSVFDPAQLALLFDELLGTRVDFAAGRDLSAWRRDGFGYAQVMRFDGLTGPTPPIVVVLPMTAADFRAKALTAAERASIPAAGARFADASGTVWHFAAAGKSVILSPDTRLLSGRFLSPMPFEKAVALRVDLNRVRLLAGKEFTAATQFAILMLRTGGASWLKGFDPRQRESAAKLVAAAHRVVADGESLTLAHNPAHKGMNFSVEWTCRPGTPSAKLLEAENPSEFREWQSLPLKVGDKPAYPIAARRFSPAVAAALMSLNPEFAAAPGDATSTQAVADYEDRLARAGLVTQVGDTVCIADPHGELGKSYEAVLRSLHKGAAYRNLPLRATPTVYDAPGTTKTATIPLDLSAATTGIADANLRQAALATIARLTPSEPIVRFSTDGKRFLRVRLSSLQAPRLTLPTAAGPVASSTDLMTARGMVQDDLSAIVGLDMAETLRTAAEFATTVESAMPAFPGWELPTIDARVLKRGETPFVAAATVSPRGVTLSVGLPTRAVRMVWEAIEK